MSDARTLAVVSLGAWCTWFVIRLFHIDVENVPMYAGTVVLSFLSSAAFGYNIARVRYPAPSKAMLAHRARKTRRQGKR